MKDKDLKTFTDILKVIEKRSTCARVKVGAIIVKDGRIISTGWNGVPSGAKHCEDIHLAVDMTIQENRTLHGKFSDLYEVHAEMGAIGSAAKNGISVDKSSMFVSYSPCLACAKLIIASGIKEVFALEKYDRTPEGMELLINTGIPVSIIGR